MPTNGMGDMNGGENKNNRYGPQAEDAHTHTHIKKV